MKRRVLSFLLTLALCLNLCPVWAAAAGTGTEEQLDDYIIKLTGDKSEATPFVVPRYMIIDTSGFTFTGTDSSVIQVTGTGELSLTGRVISKQGSGVEVQSGGVLLVTGADTYLEGSMYALDIASGTEVHLSAGTYFGKRAAIRTEDGDFAALLEPGFAYFDTEGNPVPAANLASSKTLVVKECTDHDKVYTHTPGAIWHTWTCSLCGETGTEPCTFTFENETGICDLCGSEITVTVDRDSLKALAYDGSVTPANGTVTVTTEDGTTLTQGSDYTVTYATSANVGSTDVTVTVTVVVGDNNGTFTQDYTFTESDLNAPVLEWDTTGPVTLPYDGAPVEASDLPSVRINISSNGTDLHQYLQYSYRVQGDDAYTDGLPTNAGTYDVVVSLPERPELLNGQAASSEPITLKIEKINPIADAPAAATPTFNGKDQALVTAGRLEPAAAGDGAQILFATAENGPYTANIPTGVNAGTDYRVWYKVEGGSNYNAVGPLEIQNVQILRKTITPYVTLSDYTYLYDGGEKQPKVTVKDEDDVTELLDTEYQVDYVNNRNVSTDSNPAKVVVTDKPGGNYEINRVEVEFKITLREQATLSITEKPDTVTYGDTFTLSTLGGSGNGNVTWKIVADSANDGSATVNPTSGLVTITGAGTITVKATKSGVDPATNLRNYDDATASWTFTADKKSVVATVTAEDKTYDGSDTAIIHAVVEQGVLPGDEIIITGLEGTFRDANAGVDKTVTVTVDPSKVSISGTNSQHYDVSYSSLTVKATIHKATVQITGAPVPATPTYNGNPQALIGTGAVVDTTGVNVEYALSEDGPYSTTIPKETNAGAYTVWYRVQETMNYTGLAPESVDAVIAKKSVSPIITLSGSGLTVESDGTYSYIYDGAAKEPAVKLTEADGTTVIPADEYTVAYSGNTNVGSATVTVTAKADGNYAFTPNPVTEHFTIQKEKARVITAPNMAGDPLIFNTRALSLVTPGEGYGGTMVYSLDDSDMDGTGTYSEDIPTKTNAGDYTVYYKVAGDGNHSDSDVGSVIVTIAPKTVKDPTIELFDDDGNPLVSYTYDGSAKKPAVTVKDGSDVIGAGEYNIVYSDNVDAGRATVNITDKLGGNYTVTGSATFVILKADIVFNPAPSAASIIYDGKAHELLVPGVTSGGEVLYALNSPNAKFEDAIPTDTEAGDYIVYYKVIGDKNHNDFAVTPVSVTIQRKPLTKITITLTPAGFDYDGTVKLPAVTVMDGKTVLPEEEYTWSCDATYPTAAGTYTITIDDAPGGNYDLSQLTAPDNEATFTIGQIPQEELVISGKPSATNYGDRFQLAVSGGSGSGAVTWTAAGPATIDSAGNVEITGIGEVTITVEKDADTNYLAAQTQWTFTAAPKPVTADIVVASRDYDGTTGAAVASASIAAINGDLVTIDETSITAAFDTPSVGTGKTVALDTSKVQVGGTDADKYAISYPATVTAEIKQATTSITTPPQGIGSLEYTGQPQALVTAGESNVGFLVYSLELNGTYSTAIPTGTNAGDYTVYYKVDGTADYTAEPGGSIAVTIDPKRITATVELSKSSFVYDGTKQEPTITVKDGQTVIGTDQYTVTWADDSNPMATSVLTNVGTYTATIENVAGGNYTFSKTATVEIVAKGQDALHITGQPSHVYYGDTIRSLTTTGGSGNGTVTWSSDNMAIAAIDPVTGVLTVKGIGTVTVKAERAVPNYETVSAAWTFTVEPKPVTAEVTIAAKDYDGATAVAAGDITAAVKTSDLVDPANDTITISGLMGTYDNANAGTNKTVTLDDSKVVITGDTGKYAVSCPATAKADVNPRSVTVSVTLSGNDLQTDANGDYYDYDGTEKTPSVTVTGTDSTSYSAVLAPSDYTVRYANNKNAGTASVTVTCAPGGNYDFQGKTVTFAIKSAAAKLTSSPQAKDLTYDGTAQELVTVGVASGGTVVYSLSPIDPDDEDTYSETIPQGLNAGVYTVYYMVKGDANHDDAAPGQASVTIKPKEITPKITLSQDTYTYNGNECKPTVTVEDGTDEIANTEYTVSYRDNTNAGIATVIVSDNNGGNYIVNGTAAFTIEKAAPTVTNPTGKTSLKYNGELQELVTAGVSGDGTVVYSVNGGNYSSAIPTASAVGQYTIEWKVLGDDNHKDTAPETLTPNVEIAKNTVTSPTISLSADSFRYNGSQQKPVITVCDDNSREIPAYEYTVTITGRQSNNMVDVDIYTVKITTPPASNYVITDDGSNTRTFTIVQADQETISITGAQAQVHYGDVIQLGTTGGTGGGTVTWTLTRADGNPVSSTISATGLLTVKDVGGPITVTATRSAGGNYTDVSATWEFSSAKKPVTAVLTGVDRNYIPRDTSATVHASIPASELVFGETFSIPDLTGTFADDKVGANKTITITGSAPVISDPNAANYDITYPATATASILAQAATVDTNPQAKSLTYDAAQSQELVTAGTVTGGTMVYSLDGTNFTAAIPKAKDAGSYTVYFKAQGDGNHTDSPAGSVTVTIARQTVTAPQIELNPPTAQYDGQVKRPGVTVYDSANNVIPASEYKVTYVSDSGENWKDKGAYTVKIEEVSGGNYDLSQLTAPYDEATFTISTTAQNPLEITNKPGLVHYGDTFTLSAVGGSGNAAVTWSVDDAGKSVVKINDGFVEIIGVGAATITATRPGGTNYDDATATYSLNALRKPITAIVTADDKVYDGITPAAATLHVTWKDGDLVGADSLDTTQITGAFADENVGTNKTVNISGTVVDDSTAKKYDITIPATTTASILKADMTAPSVSEVSSLVYSGSPQALVSGGDSNTLYSDSRDGVYSTTVPTGTNAGIYTVWYKAQGDANHNESQPQAVTVTISRKPLTLTASDITLSGSDLKPDSSTAPPTYYYEYDGTEKTPSVIIMDGGATVPASEYIVSYTNNKNVGTATVTIRDAEGGNYDVSGSVTFEIRKGTAALTGSPQAKDLTYTGQLQELVTVGTASGGHIEYALDGGSYGPDIPKADKARTYTVTYKVVGDGNHADGPSGSVTVTIKPKEIVSPKITVTGIYTYNGTAQTPDDGDIKVEDGTTVIPDSEYTFTFRDNIDAGTATVIITNANGGDYIVNGTGTFTIGKADPTVTAPAGKTGLNYNGELQALVTAGVSDDGTVVYSVNGGEYSAAIPTASAVGTYTIDWKVLGDGNHNDTTPAPVTASIVVNNVTNPTIQVTPGTVTYNGEKQEPVVTVYDDNDLLIDSSEYKVTYADDKGNSVTNLTNVGDYTLTITGVSDGNYTFDATSGKNTATFTILPADQPLLTITGTRERVYYGDEFQLSTTGGNGTVTWTVNDDDIASINNGLLTITGVGSVTVTATSTAPGYTPQNAAWTFIAERKPVTAVVTAEARTYKDGDKTAIVTATLQSSDLVGDDVVQITLSGTFEDPNAGTDKKVTVDSSNPGFSNDSTGYANYNITYPATTTASIFKADIDEDDITAPTAEEDLEYTGSPQSLVVEGSAMGGTMEYSTNNITYSASLPTGTNAGAYDVWYRVKGDSNHNDTAGTQLGTVTIDKQNVPTPVIEFTPSGASYDGQEHKPAVKVIDKNGRTIPAEDYTVDYGSTNWRDARDHEVKVTAKADGNYTFDETTATFTILPAGQSPLTILGKPTSVKYGDVFVLSTLGGSGNGVVTWETSDTSGSIISLNEQTGKVEVLKAGGPVTITARKQAEGGYSETTATWTFSAEKKPVTAIVTAKNKEYDGSDAATLVITWPAGALLNGDSINLSLTGTFDDGNVGTDKTVTISGTAPASDKYDISWNMTTTASITPKTATVTGVTAISSLTYTGQPQALVSAGSATGGSVVYSLDGGVSYTLSVPTAVNAGDYTVWYKAEASGNYQDSIPASVRVTIQPKQVLETNLVVELDPDEFVYDGAAKRPDVVVKDGSTVIPASEYTVSYSNNTAVGATAKVTITNANGGNYSIPDKTVNFTIKPGAATLTGAPQAKTLTYNGFAQELVTDGTAVNGHLVYSLTGGADYSTTIPTGTNAGNYSVYYKVEGENGASDTAARVVYVTIQPKPVNNPEILVDLEENTVPYTGTAYRPDVLMVRDGSKAIPASEYTVTYKNNTNPGTATIIVVSKSSSNYDIYATTTFEIVKAAAKFTTDPTGKTLTYNGTAQELVNQGAAEGGIIFYSLDGVTFTGVIPTGTERKTYTVYAKVVGDSKHEDSDIKIITAEIEQNVVKNPTVELSGSSFSYTGNPITPTVTVYDDSDAVIPATEYTVSYEDNTEVGTNAKVKITSKGSNYSFTAEKIFEIVGADQPPLLITGKPDTVYYGDTLYLGVTGGSGGGEVTWAVKAGLDVATIDRNGVVTIKKAGSVTITATQAASGGYGAATAELTFYASPKPVTALVTAANKTYDTTVNATLTVTFSGLLPNESISASGYTVQGQFTDGDVGTNKTVLITSLTVTDTTISEKYAIDYNRTTTASITPKTAAVTGITAKSNLVYNGSEQALLDSSATVVEGGNLAYSLDGGVSYSFNIPTGTDAKNYTVWYKVIAGDNYKDSAPASMTVAIAPNTDTPTALCVPNAIQYDGKEKIPTVVVLDSANRIIPESEYSVSVDKTAITVDHYTVTVTDKQGGNYDFMNVSTPVTAGFDIVPASQNPLTITGSPADVYYGDRFVLSAVGGSGTGAIQWSIAASDGSVAAIAPYGDGNAIVTVTGTGGFTVEAYRAAAGGYSQSNTASVPFVAKPKPVTPVVTAEDKQYDGTATATLSAKISGLVGNDSIVLTVTGAFVTPDVGTNKQVKILTHEANGANADKYTITWPESTTASIYKVDAKPDTPPAALNRTYDKTAQELVTAGTTLGNIGVFEYSLSQNGVYSTTIPTGTNAGKYTVWYRVADSVNYTGILAASIDVEIAKATPEITAHPIASTLTSGQTLSQSRLDGGATDVPGKFAWADGSIKPAVGVSQQNVIFTPEDTSNYNTVTFQVTVTVQAASSGSDSGDSGSDSGSASSISTTVQNGTASTVVSAAEGSRLVREAVANQSESIVIKPEITGGVTKAEVSIPASTVSRISSETGAALTVSAPIAEVTIPNAALDTLSSSGGAVSVVTEQVDQAVVLTLTAGGEPVESVPGGVTLTVPAEDAGPGTVAVLVHDDGTRETIRKSVVTDGSLSVSLDGSATVEIVDNSKDFTDVPDTSWAADAVAFASAHELFSGTSETTFSPDQAMSRGMLATVLYSLEGNPELELSELFDDVSSGAWYAEGVAWAAENGITAGYGNGQFGPDDSITREQFALMLWKYAGSPAASGHSLAFTDADQASSYALEALCWAAETGILSGYSNGQLDPGGTATRAQAAQMLKNFLENT